MKTLGNRLLLVAAFISITLRAIPVSNDTVRIVCPESLKGLASQWRDGYSREHQVPVISICTPASSFNASAGTVVLTEDDQVLPPQAEGEKRVTIGRQSIVPLFNKANPVSGLVLKSGITENMLQNIISSGVKWSDLFEGAPDKPVKLVISESANNLNLFKGFAGGVREMIPVSSEILISTVRSDPFSIGIISVNEITGENDLSANDQVAFMPVDRNSNRRIDSFEAIYSGKTELLRGIWLGKYPRSLSSGITASVSTTGDAQAAEFVKWVITNGGGYLHDAGFTSLTSFERQTALSVIAPQPLQVTNTPAVLPYITWFVIVLIIAAIAFVMYLIAGKPSKQEVKNYISVNERGGISTAILNIPRGILFDRTHTWAFMERDGLVRVGIDDFMQHVTGPVTRLIMKEPGLHIRRGEVLVTIVQEGKQLNLYAPVSGKIKSQNTSISVDPSMVNGSPYNDGWLYLIEPSNWQREIRFMFMSDRFREWIENEFERLKEFFARAGKRNELAFAHVVMQDGGEISDNVLSGFGPEIWEEFQQHFIDQSK